MDKPLLVSALERVLGEALPSGAADRFVRYADELNRFGAKLNLTAVRDDEGIIDKHFADSLLASRSILPGTLLDVGAGAGFPGVPLAIVRNNLSVTLVDAAKKKVGFLKSLIASLGLTNANALHARLGLRATLGEFDCAIARALTDLPSWLRLARPHVRPGGRIVAMLARPPEDEGPARAAQAAEVRLISTATYALPLSGDPRTLVVFEKPAALAPHP